MSEARRLYPAAVVLESVAVRRSPRFDQEQLQALRHANETFRAAAEGHWRRRSRPTTSSTAY